MWQYIELTDVLLCQLSPRSRVWGLTFNGENPRIPGSQAPNNPNADSFNSVTIDLYIVNSIPF
jgi:hypothetical protein